MEVLFCRGLGDYEGLNSSRGGGGGTHRVKLGALPARTAVLRIQFGVFV